MKNIIIKIICCIGLVLCVVLFVLANTMGVIEIFNGIKDFIIILGDGSLIIGTIILPLAILGGIQCFRGFCEIVEKDSNNMFLLTLVGFISLFFAVGNIL